MVEHSPIKIRLRHPDLAASVEQSCPDGHARVLRCHPLRIVDGRPVPFPTLFWLACPVLIRALSNLERAGHIKQLQALVLDDDGLRERLRVAHAAYCDERTGLLADDELDLLAAHGLERCSGLVGIGGLRDPTTIKCLHLHYAHHLARSNPIGELCRRLLTESAFASSSCLAST